MVTRIDLSPPPLRYAKSSTMLADGDRIQASAYGNRTIRITAEFQSNDEDSASVALSALGRELNRATNILLVQIGSVPTFYRTYRSTFTSSMVAYDTTYLENGVEIEAEPFGLGLPQFASVLTVGTSNFTRISWDPAYVGTDSLPNLSMDVNDVLGDVETPAQILLESSASPLDAYGPTVIAVRRRGTPANLTTVFQSENCSAGFDTAVATSHDATMSGVGNNYMRCTFATQTGLVNRVGFLWPPAATVEARGAFRLYVRMIVNGSGSVSAAANFNGVQLQDEVLNASGMVDLGTFTAPAGGDPVQDGFSGREVPIQPTAIWLMAARTSGTVTLDFDYAIAVPADDSLGIITFSTVTAGWPVLDATSDTVYQSTVDLSDSTGVVVSPSTHSFSGSLPMLSPGTNRLYLLTGLTYSSNDGYTDVMVRYWPRYLSLATA
jgi:hypothetical protein